MNKIIKRYTLLLLICIAAAACKKNFLDQKPDQSLLVPETLADFQALLDNSNSVMNFSPYLSGVSSDDFYTTDAALASQSVIVRNSYLWAADVLQGATTTDWNRPYQQVFYANIVLDGLNNYHGIATEQDQINQIRGTALFDRAFAFYEVAQQYAAPYQIATAAQLPGVPIRLTSDVNAVSERGTLQQTYDRVVTDLNAAAALLPLQASYKTRPSRAAAFGLLARVYQTMESYTLAFQQADAALKLNDQLIDFNTLNPSASRPLPVTLPNGNAEVSFYAVLITNSFLSGSASLISVDTTLYRSYAANDLRKTVFFNNKGNNIILFKGSYTGNTSMFSGIANDELYLIRAECNARSGNTSAAMQDLNTLLLKRWKAGTFTALSATNADDALHQILTERRKELISRNLRWTDLRRLNHDPNFATTLTRINKGQSYALPPNDKRYVFLIPANVIATSGIMQNPR